MIKLVAHKGRDTIRDTFFLVGQIKFLLVIDLVKIYLKFSHILNIIEHVYKLYKINKYNGIFFNNK